MAITVSDEYKRLWETKQGGQVYQRLRYKRRYKLAGAYYTEADWNVLERDEFVSIGNIPQQSDLRGNVIRTSVCTLKLPNENNQFICHAGSPSFWASDDVATDGYRDVRTLWQVQEGRRLESTGEIEWISVFTGVQMKPAKMTGNGETAMIEVSSKAVLLEKADAEEVRDSDVSLETCTPSADGTITDFESASVGVDRATDFQVDGASRTQGSGYRTDNANEVASAGNTGKLAIATTPAPGNGVTVKVSVVRWLRDQLIETLLGLLADEAGIPSGERSIDPVVFSGSGVSGSQTLDSAAEWAAGDTTTGVDVTSLSGSVRPKWRLIDTFADGDFTADPVWSAKSGATTGWSVAGSKLTGAAPASRLQTLACVEVSGSWECEIDRTSGNVDFVFMDLPGFITIPEYTPPDFAYRVRVDGSTIYLQRGDAFGVTTTLASVAYTHVNGDNYRVTRSSAGVMNVYVNGTLKLTATDTTYSEGEDYASSVKLGVGSSGTASFYNIYYAAVVDATTPVTEAAIFIEKWDLLSAPVAWGAFEKTETAVSGWTIAYATDVSSDDISYDGYTSISGSTIGSALKRYVRLKITFTQTTPGVAFPSVDFAEINFNTSTVYVSLANHRGKTVMEMFEQYVKLPDYELRFRGDGTLVVAPKTSGAYVIHLTQENGIIDVLEVDRGVPDRVARFGRVRYQGFVSLYGDTEAGASAETIADGDEIGKGGVDEDLGELLVANDLQLGDARAQLIYDTSRRSATDPYPPVRLRLKIWDVEWLEIGDVLRLSFFDHPILGVFQANDELLRADSPRLHAGAPGNVITNAKDWRLLYYNPNKDTRTAEVLVQEVL